MNWPGALVSEHLATLPKPDPLYGFGRIFHGDYVNDGVELATVQRLGCHSHEAAISHAEIPRSVSRPRLHVNSGAKSDRSPDFRSAEPKDGEVLRMTRAAEQDGVRLLGAWGSGSGLRAEPVSGPPCALVESPLLSRGSCALTAFHKPSDASSREKRPRAASSFLEP
jgi:hypothetical protein